MATQTIKVTLPSELVEQVRAKVQSGEYASESDVIRASLLDYEANHGITGDPELDAFIEKDVKATLERMRRGEERMYTADEVEERLRIHRSKRSL